MHFMVTYCSCGLLHMWCSGDYLQHEDGVCWIDSKQCVCVHGNDETACIFKNVFYCFWTSVELCGTEVSVSSFEYGGNTC